MTKFYPILSVALFFCLAFSLPARAGCKTTFAIRHQVELATLEQKNWTLVPGLERVPHLNVPFQLGGIVCGPTSVAMALSLMTTPHSKQFWNKFIEDFPYFAGGVLPSNLVGHANHVMQTEFFLKLEHRKFDDFSKAMAEIKKQIVAHRPVVTLLVACALVQHYVTIVGFDKEAEQLLLLDTDGTFYIESYDWVEKVMYAGFTIYEGSAYAAFSPLALQIFSKGYDVDFDYHNIFVFSRLRS